MPGRIHALEILGNAIVGGMETDVERLVENLPPERFAVTALCPFESPFTERLRARDIEVLVTPMPDDPAWSSIQMTCAMVKAAAIDLLHAHLPNAHALAGIAGRLTGKPVLATLHGHRVGVLDLEVHRTAGTTLSVVCRQSHFHALGLGVSAGQLSCNPNGVDTEAFKPRPRPAASIRAALGIPAAARVVGFLGRLAPEKGPEVFLRAALLAQAGLPGTHFVFIGDGPLAPELRETIARFKLEDRVHLAGLRRDVAAVLNDLDVMVSSSHSEAMPLAVMEALASGVPVVATRVGGVPDMIDEGESGWLVPPSDFQEIATRLHQILGTPGELARMGAAARRRAVEKMALADTVERMATANSSPPCSVSSTGPNALPPTAPSMCGAATPVPKSRFSRTVPSNTSLAQQHPRGLLQPQAQDGAHVAEEIRHARGVAAFQVHLGRGVPHQGLVESRTEAGEQQVAGEGRATQRGRQHGQGHQRADEVDDAVKVEELVLGEIVEGTGGLASALLHLAGEVALVPAQRCLGQPRVERVAQRFAHAQAHRALEHAAGPVQQPGADVGGEHAGDPGQRLRQHAGAPGLQRVQRPGHAERHAQLDDLRSNQQQHRAAEREARPGDAGSRRSTRQPTRADQNAG